MSLVRNCTGIDDHKNMHIMYKYVSILFIIGLFISCKESKKQEEKEAREESARRREEKTHRADKSKS